MLTLRLMLGRQKRNERLQEMWDITAVGEEQRLMEEDG